MEIQSILIIVVMLTALVPDGYAQPVCAAPELSSQAIKEIIDRERKARKDLPEPFPKYKWKSRREGCHYVYIEDGLPETPEYSNIFWLNQRGIIVDATTGGIASKELECPGEKLSDQDLARIISEARRLRSELPPPYKPQKARIDRMRCLYVYYEYALPETAGIYHTFIIDPFGELMEFFRGQP